MRTQRVPSPLQVVWSFFTDPANLGLITPPDLDFEILWGGEAPVRAGQLICYRVRLLPFWRTVWVTEISHLQPLRSFVDEQRLGPYFFWYHEHIFRSALGGTDIIDRVAYALPGGLAGRLIHRLWVRQRLEMIFEYRREKLAEVFGAPGLDSGGVPTRGREVGK